VDTSGLRAAYRALVAEASAGGFVVPSDGGWWAERVVAHVAVNDGLLTEVTERLLAGERPAYDNAAATDAHALDRLAHALGSWDALIGAVGASGARLCDALERLTDEQAAVLVPSRIVDGGEVILDQPVPWSALMGVQEQRHLVLHTEQLRGLRA
jgi:hypothetical protein